MVGQDSWMDSDGFKTFSPLPRLIVTDAIDLSKIALTLKRVEAYDEIKIISAEYIGDALDLAFQSVGMGLIKG